MKTYNKYISSSNKCNILYHIFIVDALLQNNDSLIVFKTDYLILYYVHLKYRRDTLSLLKHLQANPNICIYI